MNKPKIITHFPYPKLLQVNTETGRHYEIEGKKWKLPSVTTILSKTKDLTPIENWKKNVGEEKAAEIVKFSIDLGTPMHKNIEDYLNDKPMESGSLLSKMMTNVLIKKAVPNMDEVWGTEVQLYMPEMYAGTADIIFIHKGIPCIGDFKNSRKIKDEDMIADYKCQLAAYSLCHNTLFNTNIQKGVIMLVTHDGVYQEFVFEGKKFQECVDMWLTRLDLFYR